MESELVVTIEKLVSNSQGLARHNGAVIFVDGVCPFDVCKVKIVKKHKSYYVAKLLELITPSQFRVKPFCPMYNVCGSCQLQHIDYDYQLKIKKQIVEDALNGLDVKVDDVTPSPQIKEFRHKIQYPIRQTPVSKRILAGYFKPKSHEIVNIKYCPIQPEICDKIIDFVRNNAADYGLSGYDEKTHTGLIRHVVIRCSSCENSQLVALVLNSETVSENVRVFAKRLYDEFDSVKGVLVNLNGAKTNLIMSENTQLVEGNSFIAEKLCDVSFKIGANTFFQVNPKSADNIFGYVKDYISKNYDKPVLLDAYAGISAFGLVMSGVCSRVVSVEESSASVELANQIKSENNIENIEIFCSDCSEFFEKEVEQNPKSFDVTILDPPRKGCSPQSLDYSVRLTKKEIIYVSCNPSTLARDLKILTEKGAKIRSVKPFDMFCHSTHVESVSVIDVSECHL